MPGFTIRSSRPATLTWSTSKLIPGTIQAGSGFTSVGAAFPLAVDNAGNASLVASYYSPSGSESKLEGLSYRDALWAGTMLGPWEAAQDGNIADFGSIAQNSYGDVVAVSTTVSADVPVITAFRYISGIGWDVKPIAQGKFGEGESRTTVAWLESSGEEIASSFLVRI